MLGRNLPKWQRETITTSIFLSYARGDDGEPFDPATSFVARLHRDLTVAGFAVWFDRVSMPSRALTFHQEIRDSVTACDRLVLVVGPKAAASLYVRQEWQFAYFEAERIVTPILRLGDYPFVPDELKLLHCEDFRDDGQYDLHLKNLIRQLAEPAPALGKLIAVPSLPPHFLSRTDRLTAVRDALRADLDRPVVITGAAARVGMHGMGGIGKSVLAAALARDRKIREAFPDGIVWVGFGPLPTVAELQRRIHKDLGGDGAFQTEHEGRVKLRDILKDKGVLLILDDVWRRQDVDWFDVLGPRCRAMITTRDAGLLTSLGGVHHQVELLTDAESLNMLAQAAGVERDQLPSEATDLIAECGRLPLAVALCGGLIRHGFAWAKVLEQLRTSRIDRIKDPHAAKVEHENIWNAIDVSVKFLSADEQARFRELAVFPSDEATPISALRTFWSDTAGFDDWDTDALVIKLSQHSLLELTISAAGKAISLHDLVYDYVHRAASDETALHQRLLEAYRKKCPDGWHVDPSNDGYFFTHLRRHLIAAGYASELADLLHELRWLEAKNEAGLTFDLTADFDAAVKALPETDARQRNLRLLDEALRRDIHFIARHALDYPQGLFQCLWNCCWWYDCPDAAEHYEQAKDEPLAQLPWELAGPRLAPLLECWRDRKEKALPGFRWLRSLRPPLLHLGTAQKAVFSGHEAGVNSVSFSPDGQRLVSGSVDRTVRVWDADGGAELLSVRAHETSVWSVAFSRDGQRLVSGSGGGLGSESGDATVRVWDAVSGAELLCLRAHGPTVNRVTSVSYSPDGQHIVSGSEDGMLGVWDYASVAELLCGTVRVWDATSGAELLCLRGHEGGVATVAFSPDGKRLVSGSEDMTVRVWDATSGAELLCLRGHEHTVHSVSYSPDGQHIVSGSADHTVRVWDATSGAALRCLRGHEGSVDCVSFSPDGERLVSASYDKTVRVWNANRGTELRCLRGHEHWVRCVSFSPDGKRLVSGSSDRTLRVWDALNRAKMRCLRGHEDRMLCMAYSPDGQQLASGSVDKTVRVWDAGTGAELHCLRGHANSVLCVSFSADGQRLVSGSVDDTVRVWDAASGAELLCLRGHEHWVRSVSFSPDSQRLVSGSDDKTVRVWDAASGAELLCLCGHREDVCSVSFSSDGQRVVSGSEDMTIRVWDAASGTCLEVIKGVGDVVATAVGALPFPGQAISRGLETVIESSTTDQPLAWFPIALHNVTSHHLHQTWAGAVENYVCQFTLEGV